ncbi:MAG: general secretion pathway protein GspK, partial [Ottowia sp.]|nr:general secretion pathway protein GspK [Ottowia sp.]
YTLYARIAPLLSAYAEGGAVNARSAPPEVLRALAGGQDVRVEEYVARRDQSDAAPSFLPPAFAGAHMGAGVLYRTRADVPLAEGTIARLECDVTLRADMQRRLPWVVLRQSWHIAAPQT